MRQDRGIEQPLWGRDFRQNVRNLAAPPGFGHFDIAIQFEINGVLSGFRNGSAPVFPATAARGRGFRPNGVTLLLFPALGRHRACCPGSGRSAGRTSEYCGTLPRQGDPSCGNLAEPESNGEAREDIRSLVGEVVITPGDKRGESDAILRGELVAILDLVAGRRRSPETGVITNALAGPRFDALYSGDVRLRRQMACRQKSKITPDSGYLTCNVG